MQHCHPDPAYAIAYFYFDFNDDEKQNHEKLLRSLITQFSSQCVNVPKPLEALYHRSKDGRQQPTIDSLMSILQYMLRTFQQTFIIIDALDECKEREELFKMLREIVDWNFDGLHLLATSRKERDIEESVACLVTEQICLQSILVDDDIHIHIQERLRSDPRLKIWPGEVQLLIETTLMDGANGMYIPSHLSFVHLLFSNLCSRFRWVV